MDFIKEKLTTTITQITNQNLNTSLNTDSNLKNTSLNTDSNLRISMGTIIDQPNIAFPKFNLKTQDELSERFNIVSDPTFTLSGNRYKGLISETHRAEVSALQHYIDECFVPLCHVNQENLEQTQSHNYDMAKLGNFYDKLFDKILSSDSLLIQTLFLHKILCVSFPDYLYVPIPDNTILAEKVMPLEITMPVDTAIKEIPKTTIPAIAPITPIVPIAPRAVPAAQETVFSNVKNSFVASFLKNTKKLLNKILSKEGNLFLFKFPDFRWENLNDLFFPIVSDVVIKQMEKNNHSGMEYLKRCDAKANVNVGNNFFDVLFYKQYFNEVTRFYYAAKLEDKIQVLVLNKNPIYEYKNFNYIPHVFKYHQNKFLLNSLLSWEQLLFPQTFPFRKSKDSFIENTVHERPTIREIYNHKNFIDAVSNFFYEFPNLLIDLQKQYPGEKVVNIEDHTGNTLLHFFITILFNINKLSPLTINDDTLKENLTINITTSTTVNSVTNSLKTIENDFSKVGTKTKPETKSEPDIAKNREKSEPDIAKNVGKNVLETITCVKQLCTNKQKAKKVVLDLIKNGADINHHSNLIGTLGSTFLHRLVLKNPMDKKINRNFLRFLTKINTDFNVQDYEGNTPLMALIIYGSIHETEDEPLDKTEETIFLHNCLSLINSETNIQLLNHHGDTVISLLDNCGHLKGMQKVAKEIKYTLQTFTLKNLKEQTTATAETNNWLL